MYACALYKLKKRQNNVKRCFESIKFQCDNTTLVLKINHNLIINYF